MIVFNCRKIVITGILFLQRKLLDASLGFAAGVMLAASFWSLLAPAIEMAEMSGLYGEHSYAPVATGFFFGALFVHLTDVLMTYYKIGSTDIMMGMVLLDTILNFYL